MAPSDDNLLLFTPHVPARVHARGWDAERQRAFIAALARCGVVRAAAASVGMSARSAYQLRARVAAWAGRLADGPLSEEASAALGEGHVYSFAAAWDLALRRGLRQQMEDALPRCIQPVREPIVRRGRVVAWRERYNDRLAIAAMGAWQRYNEGDAYDHELRIAQRTLRLVEAIDTFLRRGPARWPDPAARAEPEETAEERRDRIELERYRTQLFGPLIHGLRDPYGPAGAPPRLLSEQRAAEREQWLRFRETKKQKRREKCEAKPGAEPCAGARKPALDDRSAPP